MASLVPLKEVFLEQAPGRGHRISMIFRRQFAPEDRHGFPEQGIFCGFPSHVLVCMRSNAKL